jgi:hypothetical protein
LKNLKKRISIGKRCETNGKVVQMKKKKESYKQKEENSKNKIKFHNMLNQTHKSLPKSRLHTSTKNFQKGGITCLK